MVNSLREVDFFRILLATIHVISPPPLEKILGASLAHDIGI